MIQSVSWQQYFLFILGATTIYYLVIGVVFFRSTLLSIPVLHQLRHQPPFGEDEPDEVLATAQHVIDELRPAFINRSNKNELLLALQITLRKYNQWEEPDFKDTITEFIIREGQSKCSIYLSEEDQRVLWK